MHRSRITGESRVLLGPGSLSRISVGTFLVLHVRTIRVVFEKIIPVFVMFYRKLHMIHAASNTVRAFTVVLPTVSDYTLERLRARTLFLY